MNSSNPPALDSVLASLRVACSFQVLGEFHSPWGVEIEPEGMSAFNFVTRGRCILSARGHAPKALEEGDLVWMPTALHRVLADRPRRRTVKLAEQVKIGHGGASARFAIRGSGEACSIFGAGARLQGARWETWRHELPRILVWRPEGTLGSILRALARETKTPVAASTLVASRLVEIVSLLCLRHAISRAEQVEGTWLGSMADRHLGPAIARMHESPERAWSVESLGKIAGLGRSAFSARFTAHLGESPKAYLTTLRLERASRLLKESDRTLEEIAADVGYGSGAAFAHAFRNRFGVTPGSIRK